MTPTAADLTTWLDTIAAIYQQELGRDAAHFEEAHYLDAIMRLGYTGEDIRREVAALRPPAPVWTLPTRAEVLANLRADICRREDGDTRDYPGTGTWAALGTWTDQRFADYAAAGLRLLPCSMAVKDYLGDDFDLTRDVPRLISQLDLALSHGLIPMLALNTQDRDGAGPDTLARLPAILDAIKGHVPAVFPGWELEVQGGPSLYTYSETLQIIALARDILGPECVIGAEFNSNDNRSEPIVYDGRGCSDARTYYTQTAAREIDVILLRLPYSIVEDARRVVDEVGGAIYRLQGAFPHPTHWPEGDPILDTVKANWRNDYGTHKRVVLFEYASYLRWPSSRKAGLRRYVQSMLPLAGYGEG